MSAESTTEPRHVGARGLTGAQELTRTTGDQEIRRSEGQERQNEDLQIAAALTVRLMQQADLPAIVGIDEAASGRRRPRYFELLLQRALSQPAVLVSLVAEHDGRAVGFIVASLYYGEYGLVEPSASIDAIGVTPSLRGHGVGHALMRQLLLNLGALQIEAVRTEVAWDDFDLLAFLRREGFTPSGRVSLEHRLDPTAGS